MPRIQPFEEYTSQYEDWFERYDPVYRSELAAVKSMIPAEAKGIEIGMGSGRFAIPVGIRYGIEPSHKMIQLAVRRGAIAVEAIAESLPIGDQSFDFVLMVTTICFLDDIEKALREIHRILKTDGCLLIGFVDRESQIGKTYELHKAENVFYRDAIFYSVADVIGHLRSTGFRDFEFRQTLDKELDRITEISPVTEGYGKGSFVVIRARKKSQHGRAE